MNEKTLEEVLAAAFLAGMLAEEFLPHDMQELPAQYGKEAAQALHRLGYTWAGPEPGPPAPCSTCGKIHPGVVHSDGLQ